MIPLEIGKTLHCINQFYYAANAPDGRLTQGIMDPGDSVVVRESNKFMESGREVNGWHLLGNRGTDFWIRNNWDYTKFFKMID